MEEENGSSLIGWGVIIFFGFLIFSSLGGGSDTDTPYLQGDMSDEGGSPTIRYEDTPTFEDDPYTTNDESNDQPVGFYGTETMNACNQSSGNCYDLDVDSNGEEVERIYFPKGGWVDIDSSDCEDGHCTATDENGNDWELEY